MQVGLKRLDNLQEMISRILPKDIAGDVVECGVWRGGEDLLFILSGTDALATTCCQRTGAGPQKACLHVQGPLSS